ncbi:MAG: Spy/CpxP family protein refolding chaperone [Balneolaceae bacterium]
MDFFKQKTFTSIAIAVLVILNIGLVTFIMYPKFDNDRHRGSDGRGSNLIEFISTELNFSDDQKAQLTTLAQAHRARVKDLQPLVDQKRRELFGLMKQDKDDTVDALALAKELGEAVAEIESSNFTFFYSIRALCTDDQKENFDELLEKIGNRRGGRSQQMRGKQIQGDRPDGSDGPGPGGPPPPRGN